MSQRNVAGITARGLDWEQNVPLQRPGISIDVWRCPLRDTRLETLNLLKQELAFLERGGYGGALPWKPVSMFRDSPSCPNRLDSERSTPCEQCWLYQFVPEQFRQEEDPCHFIALNPDGESIRSMTRQYAIAEVEEALRGWLRAEIQRLELAGSYPDTVTSSAN